MNRIKQLLNRRRFGIVLSAATVATLAAMGLSVVPAQAAFGGACSTNAFCLYQWQNLEGPTANLRWQSSYSNIVNSGCLNLGSAKWNNGDPVTDNSASAMYTTGANGGAWAGYAITVFNWANCNSAGQWKILDYVGDNTSNAWNSLGSIKYQYPAGSAMTLYHTITSIKMECVTC